MPFGFVRLKNDKIRIKSDWNSTSKKFTIETSTKHTDFWLYVLGSHTLVIFTVYK